MPVVAADIGQPSQILCSGETGYLYPPGDAAALAGCIRTLLSDPAHARAIAWQGAMAVLREFTWERNAQQVCEWVTGGRWHEVPERSGVEVAGGAPIDPLHPSLGPVSDRAPSQPLLGPDVYKRQVCWSSHLT